MDNALAVLSTAMATGKLGSTREESPPATFWNATFRTFPKKSIAIQLVWTTFVTLAVHLFSSGTTHPWRTPFSLPAPAMHALGWALFVLLSLLIQDSSTQFQDARFSIERLRPRLTQISRTVRQAFPHGHWHEGDHYRILAHLAAFPLVLKLTLRQERDTTTLEHLLDARDARDILDDLYPPLACVRVIRSYILSAQSESARPTSVSFSAPVSGKATMRFLAAAIDDLNSIAETNMRVNEFRASAGYVNHLRIFMYIWCAIVPVNLLPHSGW